MSKQNKVKGTNQHFSNIHKYTLLILILCGLIVAFAWGIIAFLDAKNGEFDAASSRTVTYSANGGTVQGGTSQTVTEGSSFVLPSVSKTGYHGATWQDSTASTNPLKPSGTVGSSGTVGYSSSRVGSPSGTAISSSSSLRSMTKDGTYYLTTDIDCGTWSPLFTSSSNAFTGTLDGQGHTITLGISGSYQYCGFFGYINGATIKNVRFVYTTYKNTYSSNKSRYNGGIAGYSATTISTITNCYVSAYMNISVSSSYSTYVGGLVGYSSIGLNVSYSTFDGSIEQSDYGFSVYMGGLVGYASTGTHTISYCLNQGSLTGRASGYSGTPNCTLGGIIGYCNEALNISNTKNEGIISGYSNNVSYQGGIVGYCNNKTSITNCNNISSISNSGGSTVRIGGVLGYMSNTSYVLTLTACYNSGNITTTNECHYISGMVAYASASSIKFSNCYNSGNVTSLVVRSDESYYCAGLLSYGNGTTTLTNCYNTGMITRNKDEDSYGTYYVAGLVSYANSSITISKSYNEGEVSFNGTPDSSSKSLNPYVAGLLASGVNSISVTDCYNAGAITALAESSSTSYTSASRAGGIVAYANNSVTLTRCYNEGNIKSSGINTCYAGGLFAYQASSTSTLSVTTKNSFNTGNINVISSYSNCYAGGIVGYGYYSREYLTNCYNYGTVSSSGTSGTSYSAGLVAQTSSSTYKMTNCFNAKNITSSGNAYHLGYGSPSQLSCYYLTSAAGTVQGSPVSSLSQISQNFYDYMSSTDNIYWSYVSKNANTPVLWYKADLSGNIGETRILPYGQNRNFTAVYTANTYTVNYNGSGATGGSTASSSHTYNQSKALTANGFSKNGFTFAGWSDVQGATSVKYNDRQSVSNLTSTNKGVVNLYAVWKSTIFLDKQDNTSSRVSVTVIENANMTYTSAPTMLGWSFKGYYTEPCGEGTQYYNSAMQSTHINDLPNNTVLYACWESEINLDLQGGNGITSVTAIYNAPMPEIAIPTRLGYTFGGYFSSENGGGTRYYTASMASDHVNDLSNGSSLYAYWLVSTYVLYYNASGGTVSPSSINIAFGNNVVVPTPTRAGYTFFGWFIDGERYSGGTWTYTESKTAIAKWGYTLTYDANGGLVDVGSKMVTDGDVIVNPIPTREGCTFAGWKIGSNIYSGGLWNFNSNQTAVAQWSVNLIARCADDQQGYIVGNADGVYSVGTSITLTATPESGYAFDCWVVNNRKIKTATYSAQLNSHTTAVAYFTKTQPTANVYASGGSIANTYLNFESETYSATLKITPEAGKYIKTLSFDNVAFYTIDSWASTLYADSAFAQNVSYRANEGNNNLWLTFNYYDTTKSVNVYVTLTTEKYTDLNMPPTTSGTLDGIAVTANYGGSVTLVGADYEALADSDEIICTAKLAQPGYEFVGWCFADNQSNILSTSESAKFKKSTIYGKQLLAKFKPTDDNPNYNMDLDNL